ncbi:hypothetical protein [Cyanobacterium sp. Dongsha4]|uniref:hypothetical protein n=1 Tax=Cyanobacterium sp. DS4 TaxID=2878255 RepID=UPI002E807370|nr:hypothetical protein [Cyanobacterium sp. Dongsha4]WVL01643.1 hypothetical protein Dongsha4_05495 [Cyanobacterium sp. Dongsha4]
MNISSLSDLEKLESKIKGNLKKHKLGDTLNSLYVKQKSQNLQPFMVAGFALFAIRFCPPSKSSELIRRYDITSLIDLSNDYYLADPITFDTDLSDEFKDSNPVFMILRLVSSQFPFNQGLFSEFARPALLFDEIPKKLKGLSHIPEFDFENKFQAITGVSVLDFITTGFVIYVVSKHNFTFSSNYLKKFREKGISIPDDCTLQNIINQLSADKSQLIKLYEQRKNQDHRFRMHDFNPIIQYPLIKPCQNKGFSNSYKDFFHAPVPDLVASRISTGIYYQMFNEYKTQFSEYFGHVFEYYVGKVLGNSITSEKLFSESEIRNSYPKERGKVPDWILIDGTTLIVFECKATRFSRAAQVIASEKAVNDSLKQVEKGLKQLGCFIKACQNKVLGLEQFYNCTTFLAILVSLEPLYLVNSICFREHINAILGNEHITNFHWQILSIDQLEKLQPHLDSKIKLSQVLDDLQKNKFNDVLENLSSETNKTFKDSFLYSKQEELYRRLGEVVLGID